MGAIPQEAPSGYRQQDCISCFKCLECPSQGRLFRLCHAPSWKTVEAVSLSRRYVLGSLVFGFFSALMIKTNPLQTESGLKNNRLIRPPGALPEERVRLRLHGLRAVSEGLPQ